MGCGPMGFGVAGVLGAVLAASYNPDFAAMARSAGMEGVSVDHPTNLADAVRTVVAAGKPYLIDAHVGADAEPAGADVWEFPGLGRSKPGIGARFIQDRGAGSSASERLMPSPCKIVRAYPTNQTKERST